MIDEFGNIATQASVLEAGGRRERRINVAQRNIKGVMESRYIRPREVFIFAVV